MSSARGLWAVTVLLVGTLAWQAAATLLAAGPAAAMGFACKQGRRSSVREPSALAGSGTATPRC